MTAGAVFLRGLRSAVAMLAAAAVWVGAARAQSAEVQLVLVCSSQSPLAAMQATDARRLFLGVPLMVDGREISPLRLTEPQIQQLFLQRALFMSLNAYERQIASQTFRTGRRKPEEAATSAEVANALAANPYSVSYLPEGEARARNLKILGRL